MDREKQRLEAEEKKTIVDIKKLAREGQMVSSCVCAENVLLRLAAAHRKKKKKKKKKKRVRRKFKPRTWCERATTLQNLSKCVHNCK
jgi:hypothetical protein